MAEYKSGTSGFSPLSATRDVDQEPLRFRPRLAQLEAFAFTAIVVALAMWQFGTTVADPDLWGHVRFGIDKIEASRYLSVDNYSYLTAGGTWFNHEWLAEMIMGAVYLLMGAAGLVVVKAVLAISLIVFLTWWLLNQRIAAVRVALIMALNVLLLTPTFGTFRPQIFTTILFTATLALIASYSRGRVRLIWLLPVIFALWVNLHGGVLAGLAAVWVWTVMRLVLRRDKAWESAAVAGASSAALFLNPQGASHIRFLIETTTVGRPEIVEWAGIDLLSPVGLGYLAVVSLLGLALLRSREDLDLTLVVPLLGLMVAPLIAGRHLQLFVPATVILGAPYWARLFATGQQTAGSRERATPLATGLLVLVSLVAGVFAIGRVAQARDCLVVDATQFDYPSRAVHALDAAGVAGNAVVTFNWGEYIIWHLGPDLQVSIDGRRETIYSQSVLQANLDFADGADQWDRLLALAPADLVIQTTGTPGAGLMASRSDWRLVYEDSTASVFVPTSSSLELEGDEGIPIDGHGLCFGAEDLSSVN